MNDRVSNIKTDERSLSRIEFNYSSEIECETVLAGDFKAPNGRRENGWAKGAGISLKVALGGVQKSRPCLSKDSQLSKALAGFHPKQSFNQIPTIKGVGPVKRIRFRKPV